MKGKIHWERQGEKFHISVPHQTGALREIGENKPNHHPYFPFSYSGVEYEVQGGREWIELNRCIFYSIIRMYVHRDTQAVFEGKFLKVEGQLAKEKNFIKRQATKKS